MKTNYFMTKQVVWAFREFFSYSLIPSLLLKQQRSATIGTILWLLMSTQISQIWLTTGKIREKKRPNLVGKLGIKLLETEFS